MQFTFEQIKEQANKPISQVQAEANQPLISSPAEPTVGQVYKPFEAPTVDTDYDKALSQGATYYGGQANEEIDEDKIRNNILKLFQQEIDATEQIYAEQLRNSRIQGRGRLGSSAAISARAGTLGSPSGEAQFKGVEDENRAIDNSIMAEKAAKIGAIMGEVRASVAEEIAAKRAAKAAGLDSYLSYLGSQTERRQSKSKTLANALLDQGLTIEDIDPTKLNEITNTYGITLADLMSTYNAEKKALEAAQAAAALEGQFSLNEGEARYDGQGNMIASRAKTYKPGTGDGGSDSSNPAVAAWVAQINSGAAKITNVPANLKNAVIQALNSGGSTNSSADTRRQDALTLAQELKNMAGKGGAIGAGFQKSIPFLNGPIAGTDAASYLAQLDRLKSLLTLDNLKYMKGMGVLSDRDVSMLQASASALNPSMSEDAFDKELERVISTLNSPTIESPATANAQQTMELNGKTYIIGADGKYYPQ